jgi:hypothetical protein
MTGKGRGACFGLQPAGGSPAGRGGSGAFGFGQGGGGRKRYGATDLPGGTGRPEGQNRWVAPGYQDRNSQDEFARLKEYAAKLEEEVNVLKARMAELEGPEKIG